MALPSDHPQRRELNDEVHARPPEALRPPLRLSYMALFSEGMSREEGWRPIRDLCERLDVEPPPLGSTYFSTDLGNFRVRWEQHTEFTRYLFSTPGANEQDPFAEPAIAAVPPDWIATLSGQVMTATHVALVSGKRGPLDTDGIATKLFGGNVLVGSQLADGAATALTDFRIHADGFGRILVLDRSTTHRQAGRMVQRLLEIDTYRMLALLAFPVARELAPYLAARERELAGIAASLIDVASEDEAEMLDRLTRLAAAIESREADNLYRFSAAAAYYELVQRRIEELREQRIEGLQTFREFTERRLAPAMNTCAAVAARQESLSLRVARATGLLSTRVDVTLERQNQAVLESMNRRVKIQLRLQTTVEGLSVAALTYYVVGLVGYAAKGAKAAGLYVDPELAMGVAVPIVAGLAALGLRTIRRMVTRMAT
ncbi:DUF3422 domain-containing protein [Rhodovastum atsumiense]|uniref:DUF3422 domain-containing protein n=1 Tax=Rhodovastum atsumiense TaxID=504468 RepID=A0A5M6IYC9_9PROT|nr:DUF3422 domain-containing protein [Rhodovastum atsumiense]